MKHTITILLASILSQGISAAITAPVSGPVIGNGVINLGSPEPVFNEFGVQITHPFHSSFANIYGELTGAESFDFDTGNDLALGHNAINNVVYTDPAAPTGNGYWSGLIGINHGLSGALGIAESSQIGFAFRGFSLNPNVATDYFINTTTNVETRIYRNGEVGIFDLSTNTMVYTQGGLIAKIFTDWDGGDTGVTAFDTDAGIGDIDTSIEGWNDIITSYYADSDTPIQVDGGTLEGNYAVFPGVGEVTAVPEPNAIYGAALVLFGVLVFRRRFKS
ncbi:hypothetical protein [Rubellicoccus peritrichatus]|uniref:PEP-CTERM protein-sorting domain-containing protein n=1 Tax=Rubellicoccus peritrichatus TaxID=3080537 RepID=A0AAQ3L584_9BACT|nr:hypothetical protein [Puniceicoccus sp. CR14]WOO39380.1 hypothetical protein RZN69_12215 [Puniceicoccus sp. CR14]